MLQVYIEPVLSTGSSKIISFSYNSERSSAVILVQNIQKTLKKIK